MLVYAELSKFLKTRLTGSHSLTLASPLLVCSQIMGHVSFSFMHHTPALLLEGFVLDMEECLLTALSDGHTLRVDHIVGIDKGDS